MMGRDGRGWEGRGGDGTGRKGMGGDGTGGDERKTKKAIISITKPPQLSMI
jgi:hypothetical protein